MGKTFKREPKSIEEKLVKSFIKQKKKTKVRKKFKDFIKEVPPEEEE